MPDLISIIVPVYNHREALADALVSIHKQTYPELELIIVDDGSDIPLTEKEITIEGGDVPTILIRQENLGAPAARNRGFQEAKGDFVIFWDADVIAEPEMLEKMHHVLLIHPEASYVYSGFRFGKKSMFGMKFDPEKLKEMNYIMSTSLIRRNDVIRWDESLKRFQDWDMWLTMLEQGKQGIWIPEFLFRVHPHEGGMSTWLPSLTYQKPWKFLPGIHEKVEKYEKAKEIILKKHNLK